MENLGSPSFPGWALLLLLLPTNSLGLRRVFDLAMQICDTIYHMISLSLSLSNLFYSVFSMFCFVIHFSDSHKPNPHVPFNLYILCNLELGMEQSHTHNTNHWDFLSHSLFFLSTLYFFVFVFVFCVFSVCVCVSILRWIQSLTTPKLLLFLSIIIEFPGSGIKFLLILVDIYWVFFTHNIPKIEFLN